MRNRVEENGDMVAELTAHGNWFVFTPEQPAADVAPHGLPVTAGDPTQGIQMITR